MTLAINNLHDRLFALECKPVAQFEEGGSTVLSPTDRAVLDHAASFFGQHVIIAETLASKERGVTDIDPTTGKERIVVERPVTTKQELFQSGS